jgi:hypothetical protein
VPTLPTPNAGFEFSSPTFAGPFGACRIAPLAVIHTEEARDQGLHLRSMGDTAEQERSELFAIVEVGHTGI